MKYFLLDAPIQHVTEKAYGICVGSNNMHGKNLMLFLEWIPISIVKEIDKKIYVPAWFVMSKSFTDQFNFNDYIEVKEEIEPRKPRKTKAQKEQEDYQHRLNGDFNFEIPAEYVEYWFEDCGDINSLYNARFTTLNKLAGRLENDDIVKINIVRNGERERVK